MTTIPADRFSRILKAARKYNASDVHLIAGLPPAFRIGGEIVAAPNHDPLEPAEVNGLANGILNNAHKARLEKERELCISYHHADAGRIRLSLYHRMGVTEMAIRMCNQGVKTIQELRLPAVLEDLIRKTSGLIIITGPTGVGKTTTLNCLIDMINASKRCKIITIEDPVEFEHPHKKSLITQLEVGTDTNSFSACLRHVLRLDPDVIAIGEMRDTDTMETALAAAETGHLVIATLHTPSAAGTVDRIVSSFDGSRQPQITQQLASTLQAVIAQRLIPSVDKKDRILATEVLVATEAVRTLIREEKRHQIANAITTSKKMGMHTLESSLIELYQQGLITMEQAYAHANAPDSLRSYFNKESRI